MEEAVLPFIGLAVNAFEVSLGLPGPAALTAITRYSYCLPSCTRSSVKSKFLKEEKIIRSSRIDLVVNELSRPYLLGSVVSFTQRPVILSLLSTS